MGRQIIKQPNGLFCIFSTIVDIIQGYNVEDLVDMVDGGFGILNRMERGVNNN